MRPLKAGGGSDLVLFPGISRGRDRRERRGRRRARGERGEGGINLSLGPDGLSGKEGQCLKTEQNSGDVLLYYFIMSRLWLANGRVTRRVANVTIVSKCPHI